MISNRLRDTYGMKQQEIALRLGVTQASISNYARKARGIMMNLETDPTVARAADRVAKILASEQDDPREAMTMMTELCDYIRFNHLMCDLHRELEPGFPVEGCYACNGVLTGKEFSRLKPVS